METINKKQTKFIASIADNNNNIEDLAKTLNDDGIEVEHVSTMLGYISGKADASLKELQSRYKSKGLNIELDREVGIK